MIAKRLHFDLQGAADYLGASLGDIEYYIKEGDEHYEESYDSLDEEEGCMNEEAGCGKKYEGHDPIDEEVMYEIELSEEQPYGGNKGDESRSHRDYMEEGEDYMEEGEDYMKEGEYGGNKGDESRSHRDYMDETEEIVDLDEEEAIEEDKLKRHQSTGYQRYSGAKAGSDQASPYGGVSESRKRRTPKNVQKVSESKIMKEYKELKSKNEEYKGALKVFKNKLNEVALFNTNLAYVNRLFTEHSTTKSEKMEILKRFDNAESIKESKSIYKSVKSELDSKSPITESVENKVNKTVKSSKSDLNESTAYVDPQITAIKDLMRKLS